MENEEKILREIDSLRSHFSEVIGELKEDVNGNTRALRGHNGTPGIISDLALLKSIVLSIQSNDIPHMKSDILAEIKKLQEKSVLWPALGKTGGSVFIAVVTALLVTLLHNWFF